MDLLASNLTLVTVPPPGSGAVLAAILNIMQVPAPLTTITSEHHNVAELPRHEPDLRPVLPPPGGELQVGVRRQDEARRPLGPGVWAGGGGHGDQEDDSDDDDDNDDMMTGEDDDGAAMGPQQVPQH